MIPALSEEQAVEICNHCGHSVAPGEGRFVNRISDCNDILTRIYNHWPYPEGDFVCASCDDKTSDDDLEALN